MISRTRSLAACVLTVSVVAIGCNFGPDGLTAAAPLIFPWEGQLGVGAASGSTVAIVLDSEYNPLFDSKEFHNLHKDRVEIVLSTIDGSWDPIAITPRSVFSLGIPPTAKRHLTQPGASFTVALFDLPGANLVSQIPPFFANVEVLIDQIPVDTPTPKFSVTGVGGKPNPIVVESFLPEFMDFQKSLEPQRMIRLRGKRGAESDDRFYEEPEDPEDELKPIGGISFDFTYESDCLENIRAYGRTEASNATVFVGDPEVNGFQETVRVVLADPKGFDLVYVADLTGNTDVNLAGTGPMLDLAFDDIQSSTCLDTETTGTPGTFPSEFKIANVLVTDIDGEPIIGLLTNVTVDSAAIVDPLALFRLYAVDVDRE